MNKHDELQKIELMKAIEDSSKRFEEITKFLQGSSAEDEIENTEN